MTNKREQLIQMYQKMAKVKHSDESNRVMLQRLLGRGTRQTRDATTSGEPARGSRDEPSDDQTTLMQLDQISTRLQMEQMSEMLHTLMEDMKQVKDKLL